MESAVFVLVTNWIIIPNLLRSLINNYYSLSLFLSDFQGKFQNVPAMKKVCRVRRRTNLFMACNFKLRQRIGNKEYRLLLRSTAVKHVSLSNNIYFRGSFPFLPVDTICLSLIRIVRDMMMFNQAQKN